jgi:hypothetical protein
MKFSSNAAAALVLFVAGVHPGSAQDLATDIVGTWKLADLVRKETATGATVRTFGERPTGHIVYTKANRAVWFFAANDRKAPAGPNPTDAERSALFNTMAGCSEVYRIEGNMIVGRCDASWNQAWTGIERTSSAQIVGKTLTLTSTPFKSAIDGKEVVVITTWERTE